MTANPRQRIRASKQTWKQLADSTLPNAPLVPLPERLPPWPTITNNFNVHYAECSRKDPDNVRQDAARKCLESVRRTCQDNTRYELWCDGSVNDNGTGGAGYLINHFNLAQKKETVLISDCAPAGMVATSFTAEVTAMATVLRKLSDILHQDQQTNNTAAVIIITDSRAVVEAVQCDPYRISPDTIPAYSALLQALPMFGSVHLVWISSHCGLSGNDRADRLAAQGSSLSQVQVPLPVQAVKAAIRIKTNSSKPPLVDHRKLGMYLNRQSTVVLNQLATDHCPILQQYRHKIGVETSPECPVCHLEAEDATHLLIRCAGRSNSRRQVDLGNATTALSVIQDTPEMVVRFLQLEGLI